MKAFTEIWDFGDLSEFVAGLAYKGGWSFATDAVTAVSHSDTGDVGQVEAEIRIDAWIPTPSGPRQHFGSRQSVALDASPQSGLTIAARVRDMIRGLERDVSDAWLRFGEVPLANLGAEPVASP